MVEESFKRSLRSINGTSYISVPKYLIDCGKLKIGQEYEFIVKLPLEGIDLSHKTIEKKTIECLETKTKEANQN